MSRYSEIEDGMGFSGLVPTEEERKHDEYEKTLWGKIREKERRILELETENKRLIGVLKNVQQIVVNGTVFDNGEPSYYNGDITMIFEALEA